MRNEKIFNAMEHLDDRFIAEVMEQDGGEHKGIREDYPVDYLAEGVIFDAENTREKRSGRYIKWAGFAAGVCVVAAGAVIAKSSGLLDGKFSAPSSTLPETVTDAYSSSVYDPPKKANINAAKEEFDLEELPITDSTLLYKMKSGYTLTYEDKLYYANSITEQKAALFAYDLKENTYETVFEVNADNVDNIDLTVLYIDGSSVYYRDDEYITDGIYVAVVRTAICRYDINTKTHEDIFTLPYNLGLPLGDTTDWTGEEILGKIEAANGYLFFEHTVYVSNFEKTENIIRYDMKSGEKVTFKENAKIHSIFEDKLFFARYEDKLDIWKLISCDPESGENEELIWSFSGDVEYNNVCYDGTDIWVTQFFSKYGPYVDYVPADDGRYGYKLRRLEKDGLKTVATVYDLDGYYVKSVQGHIITNNMIYDPKSGKSTIMSTSLITLFEIDGELYCIDNSTGLKDKLYRFNFTAPDAENAEAEPLKHINDLLNEGFSAEMIEAGGSVQVSLLNGLAAVQNDKVYYVVKAYNGNDFNVCCNDITGNMETMETLSTDHYEGIEKINYDIIGIYDDGLYYRISLSDNSDTPSDLVEFYCVKKLDINSGESETVYNYTRKTDNICCRAVMIDKYLFLEDTATGTGYNLIRYDMESGETSVFKESASAPALHGDKFIFCRKAGKQYSIYSCDLKSGENEEKLCELPVNCINPYICSDGEKIWVSVLDISDDTFTVGYIDENNGFSQVCSSLEDLYPYEFKYVQGYIVLNDIMINAESKAVIEIKNVKAVGDELYYGEYQRKYYPRTNEYRTELILYRLSK